MQRKVRIERVRLDDIDDPPIDIEVEPSKVPSNIAVSIEALGEPYWASLLYLPYVRPVPGGRYQLIRYSSLLKLLRRAGVKKIEVIVVAASDRESLLMLLSAAPGVKPLEEAEAINILRTRHRMPVRDMAIKTGKSLRWISDRIKIWKSSGFVRNALGRRVIDLRVALEVCKAPTKHHRMMLEDIKKYRLGSNIRAVASLSKIYSVTGEPEKEVTLWNIHAMLKSLTPFGHGLGRVEWCRTQELELEAGRFQDRSVSYVLYSEKRKRVLACVDENCDAIVSGTTLREAVNRLAHEHAHYNISVSFNAGMEAYDDLAREYSNLLDELIPLYVKERYRGISEEDRAKIAKEQIKEKRQVIDKRKKRAERWLYQHTEELAKWLTNMVFPFALTK